MRRDDPMRRVILNPYINDAISRFVSPHAATTAYDKYDKLAEWLKAENLTVPQAIALVRIAEKKLEDILNTRLNEAVQVMKLDTDEEVQS